MATDSRLATRTSGPVDGTSHLDNPNEFIEVVQRAREGDADAFGVLYRARIGRIGRYVGAIVRDAALAEEAVAETFLQVWRDCATLRQPERFDAWLFRIAYRRALAAVRAPRSEPLEAAAHVADERREGDPQDSLDGVLTSEAVRAALLNLSDAHREVLVLRHIAELSHREIAAQLGKSEDAVRTAYSRAARAFREQLEESDAGR